jgi:hypothetical protein
MDWACRLTRCISDSYDWSTDWSLSWSRAQVLHPSARGGRIPSQIHNPQLLRFRGRGPTFRSTRWSVLLRSILLRCRWAATRHGPLSRHALGRPSVHQPVVSSRPQRKDPEAQARPLRARCVDQRQAAQQDDLSQADAHQAQGPPRHRGLGLHRVHDPRRRHSDQPEAVRGVLPLGDGNDHQGRMHRRPTMRGSRQRRLQGALPDSQRARHPELQVHSPLHHPDVEGAGHQLQVRRHQLPRPHEHRRQGALPPIRRLRSSANTAADRRRRRRHRAWPAEVDPRDHQPRLRLRRHSRRQRRALHRPRRPRLPRGR